MAYRKANRNTEPAWFNGAVSPLGEATAKLLIVGLAPGRAGANRTGRIFTGDSSGAFLFDGLLNVGLAVGNYLPDGKDSLALVDTAITNAVACAPPGNRPDNSEFANCGRFLGRQIRQMKNLIAILALGHLAHNASLRQLGFRLADFPFGHGAIHALPNCAATNRTLLMIDSYHCSRQNTNTRRLTPQMFAGLLYRAKAVIDEASKLR